MGRIKVRFHWQRPQEHPNRFSEGIDERFSCWIRVSYPSAGEKWGTQFIPRVGQEVLVNFIEQDIDRPVILGVVHNGAQPNPWFSGAGSLPANRALSGIKTKEHFGTQYGELLFDDTHNQVRTKLSSEHGKSQLNQGYLTHPRKDGAAEPRGEGLELRTDRHGAIRAAEGLLITTEAKYRAVGNQIDREQALAQLQSAQKNVQTLSDAAKGQQADPIEIGPETLDEEGQKQAPTPRGHLDHMVESVAAWEGGTNTDPSRASATDEYPGRQPLLLVSGIEGIGVATPKEMVLASSSNLYTVSQRDTQQSTARRWLHNVGKKISLFVAGIAGKFNLRLITAKGHAQLQAQSGNIEITADKNVRLYGSKQKVSMAATQEALFMCGGAYIRLKDGNIEIHAPGKVCVKSDGQSFTGPAKMKVDMPQFSDSSFEITQEEIFPLSR